MRRELLYVAGVHLSRLSNATAKHITDRANFSCVSWLLVSWLLSVLTRLWTLLASGAFWLLASGIRSKEGLEETCWDFSTLHAELSMISLQDNGDVLWCSSCGDECECSCSWGWGSDLLTCVDNRTTARGGA